MIRLRKAEIVQMNLKTSKNFHAVYNLEYHLILVTKYRKPCINETVFQTLKDQFQKVADLNQAEIEEIAYEPDHVHMLVSIPPKIALATFINSLKSTSSRRVRVEHADHLKQYFWKDYFGSRSYMILSSGGAPIEVIRKYIQEQNTPEHAIKKQKKAAYST